MSRRKHLRRTRVESKAVRSIGYDPAVRLLQVEFDGGAVYDYLDVPPWEHAALLRAESIGRHVTYRIKGNFRHELVRPADESMA
ncbi:MAG: KTSC domain-containing protein [Ramlibacter sp.]|nr:KTSC domain-containing protein [Ramlibacter sp.]